MPSLLGIDSGLTVTKAVVYDIDGTQLAVARQRVPQALPQPGHVERDMHSLWKATAHAIREAMLLSDRCSDDIAGVAATAHGDGLYLLDKHLQPLGQAILSLDSRAGDIVTQWSHTTVPDEALFLTGQIPHASAPSALLAWLKANEPERYAQIAHVLSCKDYLRFCLCGTIGTDRTEASTSFTQVRNQTYDLDALRLFGIEELITTLPPMSHSADIAGHVTAAAAELTGLAQGTPVAFGLHDVTASSLGIGGHKEGVLSMVAGTYSINEVVSTTPRLDKRWFCRSAIEPGQWNNMAISPASTANYDWFLDTLCSRDQQLAEASGQSLHDQVAAEIADAMKRPSTLLFHPYLFGSPYGSQASASFLGLHGWHQRGELLRAVMEGIAFNHRTHVDALADSFGFSEARLTGGGSRNRAFVQLFADALNLPVVTSDTEEAAAFGAALCAGTAVGCYSSVNDDPRPMNTLETRYQPDASRASAYEARFRVFSQIAESLKPHWQALESMPGIIE